MRFNRLTPLALLLAGAPLIAQDTTGTLVGSTRTKAGKPIAGALVEITSPKLLGTRSAVTDAKGDFRIPLLPTGTYTIAFSAKGHYTNKGTFNLLAGQVLRQDGLLQEETTQGAEVTVTATAAQVDKTDTVTQTSMSAETLQTIFPAGYDALVGFSPGVVSGPTGDSLAPSIRGGIGVGTMVSMNGAPGKSMVKNLYEMNLTITDMIESVSVIQSPMNAKLGNTDGGEYSIVTSRGTNEFSGSIRRNGISRNFWNSISQYPNKLGNNNGNKLQVPNDPDLINGMWEFTLKGPLWKDHITFAYGGWMKPTTIGQKMWSKSASDVPQPTDTASTFFRDPISGDTFRQAQLSPYDGQFTPMTNINTWNQYNLYWQINTNHQLEYGYTKQFKSDNIENGAWYAGDPGLPLGTFEQTRTLWNIGYKGIIGKAGLLEIRLAQRKEAYVHATTAAPGIHTWRGQNNIHDPNSGDLRPANDAIELWAENTPSLMEYGRSYGDHDTLFSLSDSINYQHILDWHGSHVIDVGMNDLGSKYENQNVKDLNFMTFGRLATNMADPTGNYAGKYIVIPYNATVGDLTGGVDSSYGMPASMLWRDAAGWGPNWIMTRMAVAKGPGNGVSHSNDRAYYLNDQWTINEHHSVMVGLRLDHFKFWDDFRTIHSYNQVTPRFEYKFDLNGDQKRIFNFSYGQFAETPHSVSFLPYAQSYLPYRTTNYWTGAATPNPYAGTATPNAPYLVTQAQLLNPANYAFIPGFSGFSMAGGLDEQLNPNMRGPVSTETTLGFRRAFENGSFYRASFVKKTWRHLYDYFPAPAGVEQTFPQDYFPGATPVQVLPRILADDGAAHRTYKGLELEWNFIFTRRVSLGGNYTYSRMTANDSSMTLENPSAQGKNGGYDRNWRDYWNTFIPASGRTPEALRSGGHVWNAWLVWDMSTGKLKQSLALRGNYTSGMPFSNGQSYSIPRPTVPGYNDSQYANTANLPTTITAYYSGIGQFVTTDTWTSSLRYNLEAPIHKTLVWFCSINLNNWLNNIHTTGYDFGGASAVNSIGYPAQAWSTDGTVPVRLVGGPRLGSRDTSAAAGFTGARSVTVETGFRF